LLLLLLWAEKMTRCFWLH